MSPQNQPPPRAVADLPILGTLLAAFATAYRDPILLLRAAIGGLLLLGATTIIALMLPPNPVTLVLMMVAPVAAYSHFGVNWYRVVLLGPQALVRPALRWDRRHWRFFAFALMLTTALLAAGVAVSSVLPIPPALTAIGLLYVAARCSFLFPAIAVEERYNLAYAWQHTKGQGGRLTVLLLLAGLPLMLLVTMVASGFVAAITGFSLFDLAQMQAGGGPPDAPVGQLADGADMTISPVAVLSLKMVTEALSMAVLGVLYTIIALAFRTCTGWVPAVPSGPPAPREDDGEDDDATEA